MMELLFKVLELGFLAFAIFVLIMAINDWFNGRRF